MHTRPFLSYGHGPLVRMSELTPDIYEEDVMLAQAAKGDFALMRHVQNLALESDDPQVVGTLVHAYARASRCMRQNLALLAKQKSDRAKAKRDAEDHEARMARLAGPDLRDPEDLAIQERAEALADAVGKVISAHAKGDRQRHTELVHRFDRELDDWTETYDFLCEDLSTQVVNACKKLGLPEDLAARWPTLPVPTFFPDPAPAEPRKTVRPESEPGSDPDTSSTDQADPQAPLQNSS